MIFTGWNTANDISCAAVISNLKKIYAPEVMLALDWCK